PVQYKLTAKSDPVVVRLGEGASLAVTVLDDDKHPVAGAEVKHGEREQTWKTDATGKALVTPVRPGWIAVSVTADGYAASGGFTTVGSAGVTGELAITLHKGFAVAGRVIDDAGKPIAKASVGLQGMWGFANDEQGTVTDARGMFSIAGLAAGRHTLIAHDGEHAPGQSSAITVVDRPVTGIEITLKAGGIAGGTVVDTAGALVPYATVRVSASANRGWMDSFRQVTADKAGAFEVRGLARVKLQARAESETAASKVVTVDLESEMARRDVKLVLDVTGVIAGIVVDDTGAPVPEVQVNAFPDFMGGGGTEEVALAGMSSATTDGAGTFAVRGLPDGPYRLWAVRGGRGDNQWGQQGVAAKVGDKGVRITLAAPGTLKGKLVIENVSTPPKVAHVQIGMQGATPITGGVFELKDVTPGQYDVTFRGVEFAEHIKHDVKIEPGKTTDLGTVTVIRGRRLTGKVIDGKGAPVAGAKVRVAEMLFSLDGADEQMQNIEQQQGIRSGVTDQAGDFTIIGVPAKATNVAADHPERGRSSAVAVPASVEDPAPITLTLRGYGSLAGKVTMKGAPQSGVTISVAAKAGGAQATFAQTDGEGNFAVAKVPEGKTVISAMQQKSMGMSFKSTSAEVTVVAGKQTTVTIDIPIGAIALTVAIKPLPDHKVDAAQVFLFKGSVGMTSAKQLMDGFLGGTVQGMKFWLGEGKPVPEFEELVPGDYSVCTIPLSGNLEDPTFQARLQQNMDALKVYCKAVVVKPSPAKQAMTHEVPTMLPLPTPPK
nr:carboxypeptidase regulatory-like domain-containing protein [Deltaproteobacteria bacterium]